MNAGQSQIDYGRLSYLGERVNAHAATKVEQDEFMQTLRQAGQITEKQYQDYLANRGNEAIVNAALAVGALALIIYLLKELSDE
jgi:hypothetical protein